MPDQAYGVHLRSIRTPFPTLIDQQDRHLSFVVRRLD